MRVRPIPQCKRPASAEQPCRARRKALFAKQKPSDQRSSRASTEKAAFAKQKSGGQRWYEIMSRTPIRGRSPEGRGDVVAQAVVPSRPEYAIE